ncbi:AmmeMemoRadiSam system protein B [bacterium]|nr:AmmeMemoRadiSam system protein B [bacterium]
MTKIKEPAVAYSFYSGNAEELKNQLRSFADNNTNSYEYKTRAVIVPHAGLIYSGQLAFEGISQLDKNIKNIFIFAPAHRVGFEGIALTTFDEWKTPLGNIQINQEINKELEINFSAKFYDKAHEREHAIEIQIPAIQTLFDENIKIIPIVIGDENPEKITEIISEYYPHKDIGFVISSDLSHFLADNQAKQLDNKTAQMIETGNIEDFHYEQACGATGIYGLTKFANALDYSLIRINMHNSSKTSGDKSSVVGYGSWFLYEGTKNKFLKEYYSEFILKLCRDVILSNLNKKEISTNHTAVFDELGACFVTLKKHGDLRGCIGSITAHQTLISDLIDNAQNAAFWDPRFEPVEKDEVSDLTIDVSILSDPKPMTFSDEADLLNQIVPYKDGIIIQDGRYKAVYLPSVWEELPEKEIFLKSLKMKAGMRPDYFSPNFKAFRFETEYIEE